MADYSPIGSADMNKLQRTLLTSKSNCEEENAEFFDDSDDDDNSSVKLVTSRSWVSKLKWLRSKGQLEQNNRHKKGSTCSAITTHLMLTLVNLSLFSVLAVWQIYGIKAGECTTPLYIDSPLTSSMRYENRTFSASQIYLDQKTINVAPGNEFNGPPREELENAWIELTKYQNIRLSHDELGQFSSLDSIVQLSDEEGGYWATTATYHGLHCVERIHRSVYMEHYYPGLSEEETFTLRRHTEHCIDWMRRYVQCNADLTLIPLQWTPDAPLPIAADEGYHHCAAWEPMNDWMKEHSFNSSRPGLLIHPKLGDVYEFKSTHGGHSLGITPLKPSHDGH